jgi:hypothetical protein
VGEFVGQQPLPLPSFGSILPVPEDDVPSDGVGSSVDCSGGFRIPRTSVDTHLGEVVTETPLHELASLSVECLTS